MLGLDVGGAHTDAALVRVRDGELEVEKTKREYLPMWKRWGRRRLHRFVKRVVSRYRPDLIGLTMSGELADVFETRREGVEYIVDLVASSARVPVRVVTSSGDAIEPEECLDAWREVASANWRATAELLSELHQGSYLFSDLGSTTLDLIPIVDGEVRAKGRTDLERLRAGELVYLGALRTPIGFLLREVEIDGSVVPVSYEYFSIIADALVLLELISEDEYTPETPDGRGKSPEDCARRLARVVCSDLEELGWDGVMQVARSAYRVLMGRLLKHLKFKLREYDLDRVVGAGAGEFLLRSACNRLGVEFESFDDVFGAGSEVAPAVGAAYLAYRRRD